MVGPWRLRVWAGKRGQRVWCRDPGTISGYGVLVSLGERAGGEQCPQVRGERLAAVWEWLEVGLLAVLFSSCGVVRGRAGRAALGEAGTGSVGGGCGAAVLKVGQYPPGGCRP